MYCHTYVDFIDIPRFCKPFQHIATSQSAWPNGLRRMVIIGTGGRMLVHIPIGIQNFILNFRSLLVPLISEKPIQMKFTMTFIQSNMCIDRQIILIKMSAQYIDSLYFKYYRSISICYYHFIKQSTRFRIDFLHDIITQLSIKLINK